MALQSPRNNCLTCARLMEDDSLRVEDEGNTAIADVLMKHFWFTEDELLGATICRICWDQVNHFHQFYILVEEVYQIRVVSLIVKSEPVVEEDESLEPNMPELAVEDLQEEILISVQDEPTMNIADEIHSDDGQTIKGAETKNKEDEQPSDEIDQMPAWKKACMKDDFIRKHFDFTCRHCGAASTGYEEYTKHSMDVHDIKLAFIECCGQKFYRRNTLYNHVQFLTNPDIFRCKLCRKTFDRVRNLDRHIKELHATNEEKKFKCEQCPRAYALMSSYRSHIMIHDPIHRCTECPKKFSKGTQLLNHYAAAHPGSSQLKCLPCEITFTSFKDLHSHQQKMHPGELCNAQKHSLQPNAPAKTKNLDESNSVTSEYEQDDAMQQEESTDLVKEETDWAYAKRNETDYIQSTRICLEESRPKISQFELDDDDAHQPEERALVVKEESALDVGLEDETDCVQSGTENEDQQLQKNRTLYRQQEDDIIRTHVNFSCKQCDVVSESFAQYFRHSLEAHNVELHTIECCGKQYFAKDRLSDHVRVVNNPDVFSCKLCEKKFSYKFGLDQHMKRVHPTKADKKFKCDQCPQVFAIQEQYQTHIKRHAGIMVQYPCSECPSIFYHGSNLKHHVASAHPGTAPYKCRFCEKTFERSSLLVLHISSKHPNAILEGQNSSDSPAEPIQGECNIETNPKKNKKSKIEMQDDLIRKHVNFACKQCGDTSANLKTYLSHAMDAHGTKITTIDCCGKRFSTKQRLFHHVKGVNNPNLYRCELCRRLYTDKFGLDRHMLWIHATSEQKKYKCDECPESFAVWKQRKDHVLRIHVMPKLQYPYLCTICPETLPTVSQLRLHMTNVHPGVLSFDCPFCKTKIEKASNYHRHLITLHRSKMEEKLKV